MSLYILLALQKTSVYTKKAERPAVLTEELVNVCTGAMDNYSNNSLQL